MVEGNEIKNCESTAIKISDLVDAEVRDNILVDNNDSIHILNNKSLVINNEIEKAHGIGIICECNSHEAKCVPKVQNNKVSNCKSHGIHVKGKGCHATLSGNSIKSNKECGIKITDKSKVDIIGGNFIIKNNLQGILIEEASTAKVSDNTISKNIKANIAFGGEGSGQTRIERNEISGSCAEGIFLVEGKNQTSIYENIIKENLDGISLIDSKGKIMQNIIEFNQRCGIQCSGNTTADIMKNHINSNISIGILVKKPSLPNAQTNTLKDNHYQFSVDKHARKKFSSYNTLNKVKGP